MAASYTFEDLSGAAGEDNSDNPFQDLITACSNDPTQIQERYKNQLVNRNAQKRTEMLSPDFQGMKIDEILARLEYPTIEPGFKDWRNCLVFWARPPAAVRTLIVEIQQRLVEVVPHIWTMQPADLHMTALEIVHSLNLEQIEDLTQQLLPQAQSIADYTLNHRARLVKPHLNYDTQGLALQFLPAVGETGRLPDEDQYTYHHLRKDVFDKVQIIGIKVGSRYVVPSAHLTICRFITTKDFEKADGSVDHDNVEKLIQTIDTINEMLRSEYWPREDGIKEGGEWIVGQEKGLELRKGTLWYGSGGETVCIGNGF